MSYSEENRQTLIRLTEKQRNEVYDWANMSNNRWATMQVRLVNLETFARSILAEARQAIRREEALPKCEQRQIRLTSQPVFKFWQTSPEKKQ